jgi:hypothetical protein
MLVDHADAKQHVRLTVADDSPLDLELKLKLAAAEAAILDYVTRNEPGKTLAEAWTDPAATPPNVQAAVLLELGELWRFHGDDPAAAATMPARDPSADFQPAILGLLRRYTDPVFA